MEYVFGTDNQNREILKTKNSYHTNLIGFQKIVRDFPDQIIIDKFYILGKINSKEDIEDNCYDWYLIDQHERIQNKITPFQNQYEPMSKKVIEHFNNQINKNEERFAIIEDALCEIDIK